MISIGVGALILAICFSIFFVGKSIGLYMIFNGFFKLCKLIVISN